MFLRSGWSPSPRSFRFPLSLQKKSMRRVSSASNAFFLVATCDRCDGISARRSTALVRSPTTASNKRNPLNKSLESQGKESAPLYT